VLVLSQLTKAAASYHEIVAAGMEVADIVQGEPQAVRASIEKIIAAGGRIDAVAATERTSSWLVLTEMKEIFPRLGAPPIFVPESYRWPTFLKTDNLLNIANQIAVIAIMAIGMTLVIITGGIDLSDATDVMVDHIGFGNVYSQIPVLGVVALVMLIFGGILLHKTKFGLRTYAVGSNIEGCRRVGINVNRHLVYVYSLMGFTSAIAGFLSLALYQQTTIAGQSQTALTVIAGVVIGGTSLFGGIGTIFGMSIGLLIPIVLQTGFIIIGIVPFWQNVVVGVFLIAAVYVDTVRRETAERGGRHSKKHSPKESN
jgi:ribose/xylose/arabinose/galactoside ABC-type transport system permease subunit